LESGSAQQTFDAAETRVAEIINKIHVLRYCPRAKKLQEQGRRHLPMATPTQRSFWLRYRFRIFLLYLLILAASWITLALRKPQTSEAKPLSDGTGLHVVLFEDPLHASAACLRHLDAWPLLRPELPGLNRPAFPGIRFETIAESLPDRLPREPFVLVANGHAGAVALHFTAAHPERVSALVLLDASGVQEFSLLGEYHLNYALYALSDVALRVFDWSVPHFGLWPELDLKRSQVSLLRSSDRRILRHLFSEIQAPALIVRVRDSAMAVSTANEHLRLLPQSRSEKISDADGFPHALQDFMLSLQSDQAPKRWEAPMERLAEAEKAFNPHDRPRPRGVQLFWVLFALALATIFTEDLTCAITGLMIANGNLTWTQGIGACLGGILFYDYWFYVAGRYWGRPALGKIPLRWMIDPADLRETEEWFERRTGSALLITRFIPGTRMPAFVAAGILGVPWRVFTFWFVLASVIWTPLFIGLSFLLAEKALAWVNRFSHTAPAMIVAGALLYFLFTHILLPACNRRGRRKLYGKWKRLTRPEFWPTWLLYLPLWPKLLLRSLRKGCHFLDFTACNPGIPGSGIIGESKSGILDHIADRSAIAPYRLLPAGATFEERKTMVTAFQHQQQTAYPLVLKPNAGQRGAQVTLVHSESERDRALEDVLGDWIVQKYIPGMEYGVFYIRDPDAADGFIFAITRKTFPELIGDGKHNLEDLLLAHPRAVCQIRIHLQHHRDNLYTIPAAGARIPFCEYGNHACGCLFEEGIHLLTPELQQRIDAISKSFPGFYFGRYDIRVPCEADFRAGKNLSVIELNGVTSEATSIYDPRKSYRKMVRALLQQWDWACRIGAKNRQRGTPLYPLRSILSDYDHYQKKVTAAKIRQLDRMGR
jgi:membrane protein DedA with SNARE-associated domain/pimeloyl-ACP methyl ester carboxylesterase/predicted ester cyclase